MISFSRLKSPVHGSAFLFLFCILLSSLQLACSKPLVQARVSEKIVYFDDEMKSTPNEAYYAIRDSLSTFGYGIESEDLPKGLIVTTWVPTKSDSHYVAPFEHRDYAVNGAYHQLRIYVEPDENKVKVKIGSRVKSLVSTLKSSGYEEKRILSDLKKRLRKGEPEITNLGITE